MDFVFKEDMFLFVLNFFWVVVTWGWVDWCIFVILSLVLVLLLLGLLSERNTISYVLREKSIFLKEYLYIWIRQKLDFLRGYLYVISFQLKEYNWKIWVIMFICACIVFGSGLGVYFYFSPVK